VNEGEGMRVFCLVVLLVCVKVGEGGKCWRKNWGFAGS